MYTDQSCWDMDYLAGSTAAFILYIRFNILTKKLILENQGAL
jgi:hypothetical protein